MMKLRTLSKVFDGQVQNTGGAIFFPLVGQMPPPPVKQLKNALATAIRL